MSANLRHISNSRFQPEMLNYPKSHAPLFSTLTSEVTSFGVENQRTTRKTPTQSFMVKIKNKIFGMIWSGGDISYFFQTLTKPSSLLVGVSRFLLLPTSFTLKWEKIEDAGTRLSFVCMHVYLFYLGPGSPGSPFFPSRPLLPGKPE